MKAAPSLPLTQQVYLSLFFHASRSVELGARQCHSSDYRGVSEKFQNFLERCTRRGHFPENGRSVHLVGINWSCSPTWGRHLSICSDLCSIVIGACLACMGMYALDLRLSALMDLWC